MVIRYDAALVLGKIAPSFMSPVPSLVLASPLRIQQANQLLVGV